MFPVDCCRQYIVFFSNFYSFRAWEATRSCRHCTKLLLTICGYLIQTYLGIYQIFTIIKLVFVLINVAEFFVVPTSILDGVRAVGYNFRGIENKSEICYCKRCWCVWMHNSNAPILWKVYYAIVFIVIRSVDEHVPSCAFSIYDISHNNTWNAIPAFQFLSIWTEVTTIKTIITHSFISHLNSTKNLFYMPSIM